MRAADLLIEVVQANGELWAEGDRLKFRGIPARLLPAIKEYKAGILALLQAPSPESMDATTPPPTSDSRAVSGPAMGMVQCYLCRHFTPMPADQGDPVHGLGVCGTTSTGQAPDRSACWPRRERRCNEHKEKVA